MASNGTLITPKNKIDNDCEKANECYSSLIPNILNEICEISFKIESGELPPYHSFVNLNVLKSASEIPFFYDQSQYVNGSSYPYSTEKRECKLKVDYSVNHMSNYVSIDTSKVLTSLGVIIQQNKIPIPYWAFSVNYSPQFCDTFEFEYTPQQILEIIGEETKDLRHFKIVAGIFSRTTIFVFAFFNHPNYEAPNLFADLKPIVNYNFASFTYTRNSQKNYDREKIDASYDSFVAALKRVSDVDIR